MHDLLSSKYTTPQKSNLKSAHAGKGSAKCPEDVLQLSVR
jgi:hypothetical protein